MDYAGRLVWTLGEYHFACKLLMGVVGEFIDLGIHKVFVYNLIC